MNKYITISLLCFSLGITPILGQYQSTTVQTPKGVTVDASQFMYWAYDDYDAEEIAYWNDYWTNGYNCRILANSTMYYNCHGYAWYDIEGRMSQSDLRWINDVDQYGNPIYNVTKYYTGTNRSYTETATITNHLRVSYFPRDHSAVTTEDQDSVISKWAWGPLVKHTLAQCPFYQYSQIKYYKLYPGIDGSSSALCEDVERTFTSNTTISGSTYSWSEDDNLLDYVSGTGTTSYRVKAKSGAGNAWLSLQITTPSGEVATTPNKNVWVGLPGMPTTNPSGYPTIQLDYGDFQLIGLASSPGVYPSLGEWWCTGSITLSSNPHGSRGLFEATDYGTGNFYVQTTNDCGDSDIGGGRVYVSSGGKRISSLQISPNPATYEINVSVIQDKSENENVKNITSFRNDFDIVIYNNYGSVIFTGKMYDENIKINISGWQKGAYFVSVKNADVSLTGKFLKE